MRLEHRLSALLQLHLHSQLNTWLQWIRQRQLQDETRNINVLGLGVTYIRELTVYAFEKHGCNYLFMSDLMQVELLPVCKRGPCWMLVGVLGTFVMLTHWSRNKMDAISQTTSSSAFSWMKMFEFRLKFQWSLFLRVQLTIFQHWRGPGDKPLSEPMMVSLTTHICVTRPQWVDFSVPPFGFLFLPFLKYCWHTKSESKWLPFCRQHVETANDLITNRSVFVHMMAWCQRCAKPLSETMMA